MQTILYQDYIFHTDAAVNLQDYAQRPAAPGKYVSCVFSGENGRITVEVFGIRL